MFLKLKNRNIEGRHFSFSREIEILGEKFVLITIKIQCIDIIKDYMQGRVFHWRLCDGITTPYDISVNSESGDIKEISFFIEDKIINVLSEDIFSNRITKSGSPSFQYPGFNQDSFYEDQKGCTQFILFNNVLYCMFLDDDLNNIEIINQNKTIEYLIDSENNLVGIGICELTNKELASLEKTKILV